MQIKSMPIGEIQPAQYNPRTDLKPGDPEYEHIKASIEKWDLVEPLVWNKRSRNLVGGHQRLKVLTELGHKNVKVSVVDLNKPDEAALNLALNKVGGNWNDNTLATLLTELVADGYDLQPTGFSEQDLNDLLDATRDPSDIEEDEPPPVPETPKSKRGEIYELGPHRLMCGDSTNAEDVAKLMDGKKADICFTDPPYGANIEYNSHDDTQDNLSWLIAGFFPLAEKNASVIALTPGINNIWSYKKPDWMLCWFYGAGTGRSHWGFTAWQPIMVWGKCPKLAHGEGCHPDGFQFMMSRTDAVENRDMGHACPKPLSVWRRFMERLLHKSAELVYDPFLGSGTTLIAAEQLRRACFGIEIDPAYCDVTRQRYANLVNDQSFAP